MTALLSCLLPLFARDGSAAVQFPLTWSWANPLPFGNNLVGLAFSNNVFVAVCDSGRIYVSTDVYSWESRVSGTTRALRSVMFFNNHVIASGENGTLLYSDSTASSAFTNANIAATTDWLECLASSSNLAVAVGDNGAIYTSSDGVNWTRRAVSFTNWLRGAVYGGGRFLVVGEGGLVAQSTDGITWSKVAQFPATTVNLNKVYWTGARFIVVADSGASWQNSGTTWNSFDSGATNPLYAVAASGDSVIEAGDNELRLWRLVWNNESTARASSAPSWAYYCALWSTNKYIVGGRAGVILNGTPANIGATATWSMTSDSTRNWLWEMFRSTNFYIAVGDFGTILTSDNGFDWSSESVPTAATNSVLLGINGTTNLLVTVGSAGTVLYSPDALQDVLTTNGTVVTTSKVSTLGIKWYSGTPPTTNDLEGISTFPGGFIVTGGNGTILTSATGTNNWSRRTSGTTSFLSGVASFPNGLVAVGDGGTLLTSTNGTNWSSINLASTNWIFRVRYLGGKLIAVGQSGTARVSTNGTSWQTAFTGTSEWLTDVTLVDGTYFAVGTQGVILASGDGLSWTNLPVISQKSLYGAVNNGAGQLVVGGVEGAILRSQASPDLTPVRIVEYSRSHSTTNSSPQNVFFFAGNPDQKFTLDTASPLSTNAWVTGPLLQFTDSSGTLLYISPSTNNLSQEYYRATVKP